VKLGSGVVLFVKDVMRNPEQKTQFIVLRYFIDVPFNYEKELIAAFTLQ